MATGMDDWLASAGSIVQEGWSSLGRLLDAVANSGVANAISAGWQWWRGLFDLYAWQEIGCYLVPLVVLVVVVFFWRVSRMHLEG